MATGNKRCPKRALPGIPMKNALLLAVGFWLLSVSHSVADCYNRVNGSQQRFVLDGGEAYDTKTGLTWKRCSLWTTWTAKDGCTGEPTFASLKEAVRMAKEAGPEWRVPSGPDLKSIIDRSCGSPVVDKAVFPDIRPNEDGTAEHWTTNEVGAANLFYFFDFMTGQADGHSRGFHLAVRLVKTSK
jgi:hypothetical protein